MYATRSKIENVWVDSVSFLGHRVTTDGSFAVETHVLDKEIIVLEKSISVAFVAFIRENKKFESLDLLRDQINHDMIEAKRVLAL